MLQHPGPWADGATARRPWSWGRFVLIAPAENPGFARAAAYRDALRDGATFAAVTLEEVVAARGVVSEEAGRALRQRYLQAGD